MRVDTSDIPALRAGLETLAELLEHATFRLPFPGRDGHEASRRDLVRTVREYLLPRLRDPDAPVVASIVGETGVGKSVIMNSLAQDRISTTGVLRPTTSSPVLWAHRDHAGRYWSEFVARVRERVGPALEVVIGDDPLTSNLTIIDTPPIDHVSEKGTLAAREVLLLSDLCVFVTSVGRYADAAGWEFLHEARRRGTPILFVFNRLPGDGSEASALLSDYTKRLYDDDLLLDPDPSMVFGVGEGAVERWHGGLAPSSVGGLRKELGELADPEFRSGLVDQTTYSSILALAARAESLESAFREEESAAQRLSGAVDSAYQAAVGELRQELGSGAFASLAERSVWPQAAVDLTGILTRRAGVAAQAAASAWSVEPTGARFLAEGGHGLWRHGHDTTYETQRLLETWSEEIEEMAVRRARNGWHRRAVRKHIVSRTWPSVVSGVRTPDRWLERRFGDEAAGVLKEAATRLEDALEKALMVDAVRFVDFLGDPSPLHHLDERIADQVRTISAIAEGSPIPADEPPDAAPDAVPDAAPDAAPPETEPAGEAPESDMPVDDVTPGERDPEPPDDEAPASEMPAAEMAAAEMAAAEMPAADEPGAEVLGAELPADELSGDDLPEDEIPEVHTGFAALVPVEQLTATDVDAMPEAVGDPAELLGSPGGSGFGDTTHEGDEASDGDTNASTEPPSGESGSADSGRSDSGRSDSDGPDEAALDGTPWLEPQADADRSYDYERSSRPSDETHESNDHA